MKREKVAISVIIPIYNMENYLDRCLHSIQCQTYTNIEVLMINDGSKDSSENICIAYQQVDDRFHYYYQNNAGVSVARNHGLNEAQGEWICFVDPDDYLEVDCIERLFKETEESIDIVACCCKAEKDGKLFENPFFYKDVMFEEDKYDLFMQLLDNNYEAISYRYTAIGVPWGKLYRKKFINKFDIRFDDELKRMQDNIFNFTAFRYAKKIKYINYFGYFYTVEHVEKYVHKYDAEAQYYLSNVIIQQKAILEDMNLLCDKQIVYTFIREAISIYIIVIQKSFLYCRDMGYWDKCRQAKKLIEKYPYGELFETYKNLSMVFILKVIVNTNAIGVLVGGKELVKRMKKRI